MTMADELSGLQLREAVGREVFALPDCHIPMRPNGAQWMGPVFDNGMSLQAVPAYESDIAAAWLVVERMREKGYEMMLSNGNGPTHEWDCELMPLVNSPFMSLPCVLGQADTAPLAICRAALSAVRASTKEAK